MKTKYENTKGLVHEKNGSGTIVNGTLTFKKNGHMQRSGQNLVRSDMHSSTPLALTNEDSGKILFANPDAGASTIKLPATSTISAGWHVRIIKGGASFASDSVLRIQADGSSTDIIGLMSNTSTANVTDQSKGITKDHANRVNEVTMAAALFASSFVEIVFNGTTFSVFGEGFQGTTFSKLAFT